VFTTADKKIKTLQQKTRLPETGEKSPHVTTTIGKLQVKVDVDNWSNLEYVPFPFGGTATLVPPYPVTTESPAVLERLSESLHLWIPAKKMPE